MSGPIKILHVVFSLEPGGMENGVVNLARGLSSDFETHFCCLERPGAFVQRLPHPENVQVLSKPKGFHFSAVTKLSGVISKLKPDVIHTHNLGPLIYSGLATVLGIRCPVLHGEHSLLTDEECSARRLRQRKVLYRGCQRIHTVSNGLREQLIELGLPAEKIVTLLNGVDADKFSPGSRDEARRNLGLPTEGIVIGIVGRFGPFKRHAMLIEAFERIAGSRNDVRLLIVGGGGPEQERVQAQTDRSKVKDRIHLAGFQNNLPPFYRAMDLLVVPSINEGLSNAVLEAMACGVPALANETCGNGEIITNGCDGVIAATDTVENLAGELDRLLSPSTDLRAMGARARESVIKTFSLSRMLYNYEHLYRQVAGRRTAN